MDQAEHEELIEGARRIAADALGHYDLGDDCEISLLDISENATFKVVPRGDAPVVLRVNRLGYHSPEAIESELAWMTALRLEAGVTTPEALRARSGARVVQGRDPQTGAERNCVLFEFLPGSEPAEDDAPSFEALGEVTARMHLHSRQWTKPEAFTRFSWDLDTAFGNNPRWGKWQDGPGVGESEIAILSRLEATIVDRLKAFGTGPERFGLVHADTRLANLLVEGDQVSVIDFDDCGFSWFLYDLGTTVSFFEEAPQVPELIDRWLTGYRRVTTLSAEDEAEIWTFVLYRRLLLLAWIGTHANVTIAQELADHYAADSCTLAEAYLSRLKS